ncbi:MAG: helix-hairpin-helix domain-containing protein [Candidatus Omnitrophica bacterium]|nr:helix-hairpin-helix domain-containing protein [Candidatus Omnitrophota bacterium]
MQNKSRWFLIVLTSCLLSGSFIGPFGRVHAAPASEKEAEVIKVSVNKAGADELETVKGIGPMLAERIVKDREANGPFQKLEDLVRVPGIGQAKFERIKSQITL